METATLDSRNLIPLAPYKLRINSVTQSSRTLELSILCKSGTWTKNLKLYLNLWILDFHDGDPLVRGILETGSLECWKYEALESWNCGAPNLVSCSLRPLLPFLVSESFVKTLNLALCDLQSWRFVDHIDHNVFFKIYWSSSLLFKNLLCSVLVISLMINQITKTLVRSFKCRTWILGAFNAGHLKHRTLVI